MYYKNISLIITIMISTNFFITATELPQRSEPINKLQPLNIQQPSFKTGSLTVICGSMCSGKSEEIIRLVGRFILAGFEVLIFKPAIDNRKLLNLEKDPSSYIPSRNGSWVNCIPITTVEDMIKITKQSNASVIAIDEVHFFTPEKEVFIAFIRSLVESGKKVILAGLELDFKSEPFGPMPELLAFADHVMKLKAICNVCGLDTFCLTQRLVDGEPAHYNDPLIVVGDSQYEPRCRNCHIIRKD